MAIGSEVWRLHDLFDSIEQAYEDTYGEETPDISALESLADDQTDATLEALCGYIRETKGRLTFLKTEIVRIQDQMAGLEKRTGWATQAIRTILHRRNTRKATAGAYAVSIRKPSQRVEVVGDLTEKHVEMGLATARTSIQADKRAIRAFLESGDLGSSYQTDGAAFRIVEGDEGVVIK